MMKKILGITIAIILAMPQQGYALRPIATAGSVISGEENLFPSPPLYAKKVLAALKKTDGDPVGAAKILGITNQAISRRIRRIREAAVVHEDTLRRLKKIPLEEEWTHVELRAADDVSYPYDPGPAPCFTWLLINPLGELVAAGRGFDTDYVGSKEEQKRYDRLRKRGRIRLRYVEDGFAEDEYSMDFLKFAARPRHSVNHWERSQARTPRASKGTFNKVLSRQILSAA